MAKQMEGMTERKGRERKGGEGKERERKGGGEGRGGKVIHRRTKTWMHTWRAESKQETHWKTRKPAYPVQAVELCLLQTSYGSLRTNFSLDTLKSPQALLPEI